MKAYKIHVIRVETRHLWLNVRSSKGKKAALVSILKRAPKLAFGRRLAIVSYEASPMFAERSRREAGPQGMVADCLGIVRS